MEKWMAGAAILLGAWAGIASATQVELEIRNTPDAADDYLCWDSVPARARLAAPAATDLAVSLGTGGGSVGAVEVARTATGTFGDALNLTLPKNGSWVDFRVRGKYGKPSNDDKDTILLATAGGQEQGRLALMVRVRKNADTLTAAERDRFLFAVAKVWKSGRYATYQAVHNELSLAGHSATTRPGPGVPRAYLRNLAFLPWHRQLMMQFERDLQAEDASVALPYWRFDTVPTQLFSDQYMGALGPPPPPPPPPPGAPPAEEEPFIAENEVRFHKDHPLKGWKVDDDEDNLARSVALLTAAPYTFVEIGPAVPGQPAPVISGVSRFLQLAMPGGMEDFPHNIVHDQAGGGVGAIGRPPTAVRDPLFFLLHSMVDRVWAKWQWYWDRFDPTKQDAYYLQSKFNAAAWVAPVTGGNVVFVPAGWGDEPMWPWSQVPGSVVNSGPYAMFDDRPTTTYPEFAVRAGLPGVAASATPTPKDMISLWGDGAARKSLGYCYDDVPLGARNPASD